jgi:hypothetical protein
MYSDCQFIGPLLTPGFVAHALPALLSRHNLCPRELEAAWGRVQRGLRDFGSIGGPIRVLHCIVEPIAAAFGYREILREPSIETREGAEDGGYLLRASDSRSLRVWAIGSDAALDILPKRNPSMRTSPLRGASRVLRARREWSGLVTNGETLRLLICDPNGPDSQIVISLSGRTGWESQPNMPDSYRLIATLASPMGIAEMGDIFDAARLHQTEVTKTLRSQARACIEDFLQGVLDQNGGAGSGPDPQLMWRQALTIAYRLLFILKLESLSDRGGGFSFATSESWRRSLSPNRALGPLVRRHLDLGHDTGHLLEDGLRAVFRVCREGLLHSALSIAPLGGVLFDPATTQFLDGLRWGEHAVALLLDRLLWTVPRGRERERVHYGSLDVEELGRVYESLLDLEPDIAKSPMVRIWRGRLEAVVPANSDFGIGSGRIQRIPEGHFFLRSGLGRRTGGSYYTPNDLVRFLVRESLAPLVNRLDETTDPGAILRIKVFDPAMGSGHFLVEACRFLADALYEKCCHCDALGTEEARRAIDSLPDPDRRLSSYLPMRSIDQSETGLSRVRALAICRRLVTVHCLYGADRDPRAVELAKLSLWLESFAEGLPLTFLDHRMVAGDSIAGPFFSDLASLPVGGGELDPLLARGVTGRLRDLIGQAMTQVRTLEASIGGSIADVLSKEAAKSRLDQLLSPLRALARAWSGAVICNAREVNDEWLALARAVSDTGDLPDDPPQATDHSTGTWRDRAAAGSCISRSIPTGSEASGI